MIGYESDLDIEEEEQEEMEERPVTPTGSVMPSSSPSTSPDHKRPKISDLSFVDQASDILTFEEFNGLPIASRNHIKWNQLLRENQDFWLKKCQRWSWLLDSVYKSHSVSSILL